MRMRYIDSLINVGGFASSLTCSIQKLRRGATALCLTLLLALMASLTLMVLPAEADTVTRYEFKLVPLGSLTALQKEGKSASRTRELETLLNEHGKDGWDVANIFAVRTTFDPNVFFVVMRRPLSAGQEGK